MFGKVAVWLGLAVAIVAGQLTLPLASHQLREEPRRHLSHNLVGHETYRLKPMRTIFTLPLEVNGLSYHLSIDTGSSDLFIKGYGMEGNPPEKYRCDVCESSNEQTTIGYLDGFLSTYHLKANITLGVHNFSEHILVAYQTNSSNYKKMGGIVGLSFQELARNKHPNFINTLIKEGIIEHYIFAVKLNFKQENESFITFGSYDEKFIAKGHELVYHDIPGHHKEYRLEVDNVVLGDKEMEISEALLDTGNTCISIPDKYTQDILNEFNTESNECHFEKETGNTQFTILECLVNNFDELPKLHIKMNNHTYTIEKEHYLDKCKVKSKGVYKCTTLLENVKYRSEIFLGDTFFLRYYAIFDLEKRRIGLVRNNDETTLSHIIQKE